MTMNHIKSLHAKKVIDLSRDKTNWQSVRFRATHMQNKFIDLGQENLSTPEMTF